MFSWLPTCLLTSLLLSIDEGSEIIGGRVAVPHSRPYMALLETGGYLCGGALIEYDWVLTAAHCACDSSTKIKLGAHLKKNDGKIFNAKNCIQHKAYNKCTNDNDLQLVQLSNKAKQTKNVKIQPLPKIFNDVEEGTVCDTAGWGAITSNRRTFPGVLMEVNLTAISRKRCAEMWKPHMITENMMCTLDASGKKDVCGGDSGGPLLCKNTLRGIVSFGPKTCGYPKRPSVYTFLTETNLTWIKKVIKKGTNTTY